MTLSATSNTTTCNLHREYKKKYPGEPPNFFGKPSKLGLFYLDDSVAPSELLRTTPHINISQHFVGLPMATLQTLSMSGILAPVHQMMDELDYSELLKILFFASFPSTPAAFKYAFVEWGKTCKAGDQPFYSASKIMQKPLAASHQELNHIFTM